jgi:hypothetical protein
MRHSEHSLVNKETYNDDIANHARPGRRLSPLATPRRFELPEITSIGRIGAETADNPVTLTNCFQRHPINRQDDRIWKPFAVQRSERSGQRKHACVRSH